MTKEQGLREGCRREGRSATELVWQPSNVELSEPKKEDSDSSGLASKPDSHLALLGMQMWKVKARLAALELPFL